MKISAHRPTILGRHGVVASGHWLASQVGLKVLMEGGNAIDAAVATSAVLCVTRPHMCGLGGDGFLLFYSADEGRVHSLNGSGPAPIRANIDLFTSKGLKAIPHTGVLSLAVPGLVDVWSEMLGKFGTRTLRDLLRPAIQFAREGIPVYGNLANTIRRAAYAFPKSIPNAFFAHGSPPGLGDILNQSGLASSLEKIAAEGREGFYQRALASTICDRIGQEGGLLDLEDLATYRSRWYPPLDVNYRGFRVFGQPPVSQGHIFLEMLGVLEGFNAREMGFTSPDLIHVSVEAKKLAFEDRIRYLADPDFIPVPTDLLLSKEHAEEMRRHIRPEQAFAARSGLSSESGETTYLSIVDEEGNAASLIQSLLGPFGSGVIVEGTGIVLNNRLSSFTLDRRVPNHLEPGKRPAHTLNSYVVLRDGELFLVGGTPGVDDQVQSNAQVVVNVLDFGLGVQEAIEAPRWSSRAGTAAGDEKSYELWLEDRFPSYTFRELERRGHKVRRAAGWSFGGAEAIMIDRPKGVLMGGADPRRDGYAVGW